LRECQGSILGKFLGFGRLPAGQQSQHCIALRRIESQRIRRLNVWAPQAHLPFFRLRIQMLRRGSDREGRVTAPSLPSPPPRERRSSTMLGAGSFAPPVHVPAEENQVREHLRGRSLALGSRPPEHPALTGRGEPDGSLRCPACTLCPRIPCESPFRGTGTQTRRKRARPSSAEEEPPSGRSTGSSVLPLTSLLHTRVRNPKLLLRILRAWNRHSWHQGSVPLYHRYISTGAASTTMSGRIFCMASTITAETRCAAWCSLSFLPSRDPRGTSSPFSSWRNSAGRAP